MTLKLPKTLTELTAEQLRRMIITGELKFGTQIVENDLAARFGLSKTPVREALLLLKKEGLVDIRPRVGTFVFAPSEADIHNLMDVRSILEPGAMRFAMDRNPARLLKDLGHNVEQSERVVARADTPAYLKLDRQFHGLFFLHSGNPHLCAFSDTVSAQMHAIRHRIAFGRGFMTRSIAAHQTIFSQLRAGRVDEACTRLGQHIQWAIDPETILQLVNEGAGNC